MKAHTALMSLVLALFLTSCGDSAVNYVKNNSYDYYPQATIGSAFDSLFDDPEWKSREEGGKIIVSFKGEVTSTLNSKIHDSIPKSLNSNKDAVQYFMIYRDAVQGELFENYWKERDAIFNDWFKNEDYLNFQYARNARDYVNYHGNVYKDPVPSYFFSSPNSVPSNEKASSFRVHLVGVEKIISKQGFSNDPEAMKALEVEYAKIKKEIEPWKKKILEAHAKKLSDADYEKLRSKMQEAFKPLDQKLNKLKALTAVKFQKEFYFPVGEEVQFEWTLYPSEDGFSGFETSGFGSDSANALGRYYQVTSSKLNKIIFEN